MITIDPSDKVYVAGHSGMVGSAIVRRLKAAGHGNFIFRTSSELDLRDQKEVEEFFERERPKYVFLAAAHVGGIHANNTYRAEFIYDNLMIESNVIHSAWRNDVQKLLFLGSSCIYPKMAPQPLEERSLLTGPLEITNEPYAIAKIAGIKLCDAYRAQYGCDFISVMPTNLYGPNDNYDLQHSHVIPALLRKFIVAARRGDDEVVIWGTGQPRREFLHVDDLADACVFLFEHYSEPGFVNIGSGVDISIMDLAKLVAGITGFKGRIKNDLTKPDGTPRKLLSVEKLTRLGWNYSIELEEGLRNVYAEIKDSEWR